MASPGKAGVTAERGVARSDAHLGAAIRARRRELGRTLVQVALATGLSHPFLSQIERGLARPSMRSLYLIADALETTQQSLLARGAPSELTGSTVAATARPDADQGVHEARLVDHDPAGADVTEIIVESREFEAFFVHDRRELVYVVSGAIEVELLAPGVGETPVSEFHTLSARESIAYPGGTQHRHRRVGDGLAIVVLVHSGTEFTTP